MRTAASCSSSAPSRSASRSRSTWSGVPSPTLFAALVVGLAAALTRPQAGLTLPPGTFLSAQAVLGVTIGAYLQTDALNALGARLAAGR